MIIFRKHYFRGSLRGAILGVFGTAPYMAPEMLQNEGYDFLADVWSIGCVAYLLFFGNFPYSPSEVLREIRPECVQAPQARPTFRDILGLASTPHRLRASAPAVKKAIIEDKPPLSFPAGDCVAGSGAVDFTRWLLRRSAVERPTAAEALRHDFVASSSSCSL